MRFPHLAHRSAAAHKLHSTTATTRYEFDSGEGETFSRQPALAYSPRKLSKQPEPSQTRFLIRQVLSRETAPRGSSSSIRAFGIQESMLSRPHSGGYGTMPGTRPFKG
jgi:hypothetical protein